MTSLYTPAFNKAATVSMFQCKCFNLQYFKVSGIYPYNPDIFTDADFLPSAVTEREIDDNNCLKSQQENPQEATPQEQREPVMDIEPRDSVLNKEPEKSATLSVNLPEIEIVSAQTKTPAQPVVVTPDSRQKRSVDVSPAETSGDIFQVPAVVPSCSNKSTAIKVKLQDIYPIPKLDVRKRANKRNIRNLKYIVVSRTNNNF